jgi:hypothetical protein
VRVTRLLPIFAVASAFACSRAPTEQGLGCVAIQGVFNPAAPGFIIEYSKGVDPVVTTAQLSAKYSFTPTNIYTAPPGFAAELSAAAVKGLQCEQEIALIEHDGIMHLGSS